MSSIKFASKTLGNLLLLVSLSLPTYSIAQVNVLWESRYTSTGQNTDSGKEITIDNSGNVYVTGTSYTNPY